MMLYLDIDELNLIIKVLLDAGHKDLVYNKFVRDIINNNDTVLISNIEHNDIDLIIKLLIIKGADVSENLACKLIKTIQK